MLFRDTVKTAYQSLQSNRSRSALTILGIVIGISSVILMISVGKGAESLILNEIRGIGSRTIAIVPGRQLKGPADVILTFTDSLKERDLAALLKEENVPEAQDVMPAVFGGVGGSFGDKKYTFTLLGGSDSIQKIFNVAVNEGYFFTKEDVLNNARVIIIGQKVKEELFGSGDALGQKIKIKGNTFKVIGVLPPKGQFIFLNLDEAAMMPYTTAQHLVFGIKHFNRIMVNVETEDAVSRTKEDIARTLRETHNIASPKDDDFFLETQADAIERVGVITSILTILLSSIAAISLIVGGIGIMNIMLVSVTERTREIGLRKAVGATTSDILKQFLSEAILLTAFGGVAGILLGAALAYLIALGVNRFLGYQWSFIMPLYAIVLAFGVSSLIGLVFGIYPARRASRLNPIDALRYE